MQGPIGGVEPEQGRELPVRMLAEGGPDRAQELAGREDSPAPDQAVHLHGQRPEGGQVDGSQAPQEDRLHAAISRTLDDGPPEQSRRDRRRPPVPRHDRIGRFRAAANAGSRSYIQLGQRMSPARAYSRNTAPAPPVALPSGSISQTPALNRASPISGNRSPTSWEGRYSTRSPVIPRHRPTHCRQNPQSPSKTSSGPLRPFSDMYLAIHSHGRAPDLQRPRNRLRPTARLVLKWCTGLGDEPSTRHQRMKAA